MFHFIARGFLQSVRHNVHAVQEHTQAADKTKQHFYVLHLFLPPAITRMITFSES